MDSVLSKLDITESRISSYDLHLQDFVTKFSMLESQISIVDNMIQTSLQGQEKLSKGLEELYEFQEKTSIKVSKDFLKVQDDLVMLFETTKYGIHVLRDGQDDLQNFLAPIFGFVTIIKDELNNLKWAAFGVGTVMFVLVAAVIFGFGRGVFLKLLFGI